MIKNVVHGLWMAPFYRSHDEPLRLFFNEDYPILGMNSVVIFRN